MEKDIKWRNELKCEINAFDSIILKNRLNLVLQKDSHINEMGVYSVKSLYFDTPTDKALREKVDGVNIREKYRIRYYDNDLSFIRLEKKAKQNGKCKKTSCPLTKEEVLSLLNKDYGFLQTTNNPFLREFYEKIKAEGLMPKTIVEYTREPFIFEEGNVRITIDSNLRLGLQVSDFLNPDYLSMPVINTPIILEIKWDDFLPSHIRDLVNLEGRFTSAFSKYRSCRIYG